MKLVTCIHRRIFDGGEVRLFLDKGFVVREYRDGRFILSDSPVRMSNPRVHQVANIDRMF